MKTYIRKQEKATLRNEVKTIFELPLESIKEMHWLVNNYSKSYVNADLLFEYYSNESNFCSALAAKLECSDAKENVNLIIENFLEYWRHKKEEASRNLDTWNDICDKQVWILETMEWDYYRR